MEKLKRQEEDLSAIKEKNAQLSDELLNKSRQIKVLENSTSDEGQIVKGDDDDAFETVKAKVYP